MILRKGIHKLFELKLKEKERKEKEKEKEKEGIQSSKSSAITHK